MSMKEILSPILCCYWQNAQRYQGQTNLIYIWKFQRSEMKLARTLHVLWINCIYRQEKKLLKW